MAKVIKKGVVKREKGKLYFINKAGDVCSATMERGKKKTAKKKAAPKKTANKKATTKKATPKKKATKRK
ncbi:MAG: hypothetical protein NTZ59_02360 [Bacteroidetes bacterium]|nr:hypothetical protein [Bacteroidota bacterium]